MQRAYRLAIAYFALFGILLMASGSVLFFTKIGMSPDAIFLYYRGGENVIGKSAYGLLESAVPHLGAMGLFIMVTVHFLLFASETAKRRAVRPAAVLFAAALLDIAAGPMIAAGFGSWVWVKAAAFFVLITLGTLFTLALLYYAFWHSWLPPRRPR